MTAKKGRYKDAGDGEGGLVFLTGDFCAEGIETLVDVFVAAVDLVDVVDAGGAFGTHGSDEQGDAGADVGAGHVGMTQLVLVIDADNGGAVGIAEDNLCAHVDELIDEEETRLEHLLMDEHHATGLGGCDKQDGEEVGREAGPGGVGDGHDGPVDERVNLIVIVGGDIEVVAALLDGDAEATEGVGNDAEVRDGHVADGELGACHGCHADE